MKLQNYLLLGLITFSTQVIAATKVYEYPNNKLIVEYSKFTILMNCEKKGYDMFFYKTERDTGNLPRFEPFNLDKDVPSFCQQKSNKTYSISKKNNSKYTYDRGHGVHQNIWDNDIEVMKESNFMTNIVPQESYLNRKGLWRYLEKVTECYRDINDLYVIGGVVWGDDKNNDYFVNSHGIETPDYFYKIIVFNYKDVFAWLMPNNDEARQENANQYLVSPAEIQKLVGYDIPIDSKLKNIKEKYTPRMPKGCSLK